MAKKFRIAFPVVIKEEHRAYPITMKLEPVKNGEPGPAVWLKGKKKTSRGTAGDSVRYPLAADYPFIEGNGSILEIKRIFSSFSQALKEEDKAMKLTFVSDEPGHPEVKKGADGEFWKMDFTPLSAGVALHLMEAIKSCDTMADETILISAQLKDCKPAELGYSEDVKAKARLCLADKHTLLFLHNDDWKALRDDTEFEEVAGEIGDVSSSRSFEKALKEGRRIFPLAVESKNWKDNDEWRPWRKVLCKLLNMEFVRELSEMADDAPEEGRVDLSELPEPEAGSPLSLFLRAVEEDEWLPRDLREAALKAIKNDPSAEAALKALPPESLASPELDWNKEELFWLSQANRKSLMPNIIICGPTGSGKTLLAQALLLNALTENGKALYIGPTRALVEEVYSKVSMLLPNKDVVLSTGEECQDDWRFRNSNFDIACIVNEKANVILPMNPAMMKKLAVVVVDEIHMLSSEQRGGPLDMLLVKLRQKQELEGSDCRLRIVALTTEFSSEDKDQFSDYLTRSSDEKEVRPLVVTPLARPQEVLHSLVLYNCGLEGRRELTLSEFSSQDDRQLGKERALALKKEIERAARALHYPQNSRRVSRSDFSSRRAELLIEYAQKANRCLAVVNSKEQIEALAALISEKRGENPVKDGPNAKAAKKIEEICSMSCLADGLVDELVEQAKNGVYRHHADIPQNLRQVVEELFRCGDKPNGEPTPILLCTETLSYGVNLRADMVVLFSLEFPRQDGSKKDFLTATEYHNILGRVGRFKSEGGQKPKAIVMLSQDFDYPAETPNKLAGYYEEIDSLKSASIHAGDLRNFRQGRLHDLDSVSFPSFRTVMDALRTAQSQKEKDSSPYVRAKEVCRVLKDTFYCQQKESKMLAELDEFVVWMLDSASEMASSMSLPDDLSLVKRVPETGGFRYHLEPQGAALIDTGTSWKSLKHMHRWIERLSKLGDRKLPAELFLPAFIADYNVFEEMVRPLKRNYARGRERPNDWLDELKGRLRERLSNLLADDMKDLTERYMEQLLGSAEDCGFIEGCLNDRTIWERFPDSQKKHLFLCVMLITLYWLNGEHEKMLDLTKNTLVPKSRQQNISERRFDRMSWSVQMCRSFFKDSKPVKEHIADFSNLVLRLRKGVPEKGLPFAYGGQLTSQQIHQLLEKGITPFRILSEEDYPEGIDKKGLHLPSRRKLVRQVKNFYGKECDRLQKELSSTSDDSLKKFLEKYCFQNSLSEDALNKFVDVCKLKGSLHSFKEDGVFWFEFPWDKEKSTNFCIRLLNCAPNSNDTNGIDINAACDLRFRKPEGEAAVFTPCALYTLGMKMDGGGIDWGSFFDSITPGSMVTVASVLEYTGHTGDLAAIMEIPLE